MTNPRRKGGKVVVTDTGEAAALHTLGCIIDGWPDACDVSNTYSKKTPFRSRQEPGEIAYGMLSESCTADAEAPFAAGDVLRGYRNPEASAEALGAAIDSIADAGERRAVKLALAGAMAGMMAAFLGNVRTISQLWKKAPPHERILRKKRGPIEDGECPYETYILPLSGPDRERAMRHWKLK